MLLQQNVDINVDIPGIYCIYIPTILFDGLKILLINKYFANFNNNNFRYAFKMKIIRLEGPIRMFLHLVGFSGVNRLLTLFLSLNMRAQCYYDRIRNQIG